MQHNATTLLLLLVLSAMPLMRVEGVTRRQQAEIEEDWKRFQALISDPSSASSAMDIAEIFIIYVFVPCAVLTVVMLLCVGCMLFKRLWQRPSYVRL